MNGRFDLVKLVKKIIGCILLLLLSSEGVQAQEKEKEPHGWSFGANGYYGAILRYRSGISVLNFTHAHAVEIFANIQTKGRKEWQRRYNHPQIGFALSYYNYGVPHELGEAYSITSYYDNYLLKGRKNNVRFSLGTGFVYSTRRYEPITNEGNSAIGSKISFALRGNVRYEIALNPRLFLNFDLAFRHFSNGGLNKPNNGMNFPLIGTGIRYQPNSVAPVTSPKSHESYDKRIRFNLKIATARKEVLLIDEKHPIYSISMYASRKISHTNALLIGVDGIWDSALRHEYINISLTPPPDEEIDPKRYGISVGHDLQMGKLSFLFQFGGYLYEPQGLFPDLYQRYGLKYNLTRFLSVNAMLMAHTGKADFVEFGLGVHL